MEKWGYAKEARETRSHKIQKRWYKFVHSQVVYQNNMGFIRQISTTNNLNFVEQNSRDWVSDVLRWESWNYLSKLLTFKFNIHVSCNQVFKKTGLGQDLMPVEGFLIPSSDAWRAHVTCLGPNYKLKLRFNCFPIVLI